MVQVALPLTSSVWLPTKDGDPSAFALFENHYTFRPNRKQYQFVGPGESLVLLTQRADALFVWRKFINDSGDEGVNCSIFHNAGPMLSSELINQAETLAWSKWPGERLYTYVNPRKIRSTNPGFCFQMAGWNLLRNPSGDLLVTKRRKYAVLEKLP